MAQVIEQAVSQDNSCQLKFQLVDYDGTTGVSVANIDTATLTLQDKDTAVVINSREDVDVKDQFDTEGWFRMILLAADNPILCDDEVIEEEVHVATIHVTATGAEGTIDYLQEFHITVTNLRKVANS